MLASVAALTRVWRSQLSQSGAGALRPSLRHNHLASSLGKQSPLALRHIQPLRTIVRGQGQKRDGDGVHQTGFHDGHNLGRALKRRVGRYTIWGTQRIRQAFPAMRLTDAAAAEYSPIRFVSPGAAPSLIVHGDADTAVPMVHAFRSSGD